MTNKYFIWYEDNWKRITYKDSNKVFTIRCTNCWNTYKTKNPCSTFKAKCNCQRKHKIWNMIGCNMIIWYNERSDLIMKCVDCWIVKRDNWTNKSCICKSNIRKIWEIYCDRKLINFDWRDQYTVKCIYCWEECRGTMNTIGRTYCRCRHAQCKYKIWDMLQWRMVVDIDQWIYKVKCKHCWVTSKTYEKRKAKCNCRVWKLYDWKLLIDWSKELWIPMGTLRWRVENKIPITKEYYPKQIKHRYKDLSITEWSQVLDIPRDNITSYISRKETTLENTIKYYLNKTNGYNN